MDTKQKILEVARGAFAEHGVKDATVRDICAKAGANMAAVHYHFGSKEKLFMAVLTEQMLKDEALYPVDMGLPPDAPASDRLLAYIRSMLYRIAGNGDPQFEQLSKLFVQELFDPSEHFSVLMERFIKPQHAMLVEIVRELLPLKVEEHTVQLCAAEIIGHCLQFDTLRQMIRRICPGIGLDQLGVEQAATFVFNFSMAGVACMKASKGE